MFSVANSLVCFLKAVSGNFLKNLVSIQSNFCILVVKQLSSSSVKELC